MCTPVLISTTNITIVTGSSANGDNNIVSPSPVLIVG